MRASYDGGILAALCLQYGVIDPHNILNPGGTLGLDMSLEQKDKRWGFRQ